MDIMVWHRYNGRRPFQLLDIIVLSIILSYLIWKMMANKIYRSYSYVIFGAQKVGKTNIITRFTKDQFTEGHTMTLEGQQTAMLSIDGRIFEICAHDTAGQENMITMKAVWRNNKNGYIFVFAINSKISFDIILREINEIKQHPNFKQIPAVLVGNKIDLHMEREVQKHQAALAAEKFGMKYFEVSAKSSMKEKIDRVFFQLIDINQIQRFQDKKTTNTKSLIETAWHPCEQGRCCLM